MSIFLCTFVLIHTIIIEPMYISTSKSKNVTIYYVCKSFRKDGGTTSKRIETLGTIDDIRKRCGDADPIEWAREYAKELTAKDNAEQRAVTLSLRPGMQMAMNEQKIFNGGYLALSKIYHRLGLDRICQSISAKYGFEYDLDNILSNLIYTRVLYPGSKLSSFAESHRFIEQPRFKLEEIYRSLSVLSKESGFIQSQVFRNSLSAVGRDTSVIYYDCSNFFFEIEQADTLQKNADGDLEPGLRQYGHSKEHRPNPIVQMGLFMDRNGLPLAFCIDPGNMAETKTLVPLEKKLDADFGMSDCVVCTDAGLSSLSNRRYNNRQGRHFITVQSLKDKKIASYLQQWALDAEGWHVSGQDKTVTLFSEEFEKVRNKVLYKERWINENNLEQRLIITYSEKYANYQRTLRQQQIDRALKSIKNGTARRKKKSPNDASRFIAETHYTGSAEVATKTEYTLDLEAIEKESRFDGFYAICSNLEEEPAVEIIRANSQRWEIEDMFRTLKTEFESRPVYLRRNDRIVAHFITCFLALLIFKTLKLRLGLPDLTTTELRKALIGMDYLKIRGEGYMPVFKGDETTSAIASLVDPALQNQVITMKKMKAIVKSCVKVG